MSNIAPPDSNSRDVSSTRAVERTAKLSAAFAIKPPTNTSDLASGPAVKISVKREGFYRVSQPQLLAAGLSAGVNPRFLQLFVDGQELPINVIGDMDEIFSYAKTSWKRKPQFALFAGDATFDPRNYLGLGDNDYVPTKLVETAFNETASDDWMVDFNGDLLPDLAVGRLPVRTAQETTAMVTMIVGYDQSPRSEEVLLVADRNEGFNFETASAELRQIIPSRYRVNEVMRGSMDDATARANVLEATNRGQKVINYLGHGSTRVWAGSMLHANDAPSLTNTDHLSLIVAMTCLNGMFQHPTIESFAEAMLKAGQGGAVAVWASSGMTAPNGQKAADRELIEQLMSTPNMAIGEATVRAKAVVTDQDTRRTWILFGDPSAKLR